jgi:hypothetical protein
MLYRFPNIYGDAKSFVKGFDKGMKGSTWNTWNKITVT